MFFFRPRLAVRPAPLLYPAPLLGAKRARRAGVRRAKADGGATTRSGFTTSHASSASVSKDMTLKEFWRINDGNCLAVALHVLLQILGDGTQDLDLREVIKAVGEAMILRGEDPLTSWAAIVDTDKVLLEKHGAKLTRCGQGGSMGNLSDCKDKELANLRDEVQPTKVLRFECFFEGTTTTTRHIVVLSGGFLYNGPPSYRVEVTDAAKTTVAAARSFFNKYVAATATKCMLRDVYILERT